MIDYNFEYYFYSKIDTKQEPINRIKAPTRYYAAMLFAKTKGLSLKSFLQIFSVSK